MKTIEQILKEQLGELMFQIASQAALIEQLRAELAAKAKAA